MFYKYYADEMIRRCVPEDKVLNILFHCHNREIGDHFSTSKIIVKVKQFEFYWSTMYKDVRNYVRSCDECQRIGNISKKYEMPLNVFLEIKLFEIWDIDIMGPFPDSNNNKCLFVAVDYVSKWVETTVTPTNDAKVIIKFIKKNIFTIFGIPRAIVSDEGKHFCNKWFDSFC